MMRLVAFLFYRPMTQTDARAALKALTSDLSRPQATRDGYDRPDGREKQTHVVRILRSVIRRVA